MAGQIIPKGKKKWLVRVFAGRDGTGKRKYVSELVHGGKKEANARLTALLSQKNADTLLVRPTETVNEYLDAWLETTARPSVRPRTFADYEATLDRYVRPHLGSVRLARVSPIEVRGMLTKLQDEGLGPRVVRKALEVLRNALEQAVSDRLIRENPARARLVKKALPRKTKKTPVTIGSEQVSPFIEVARGDRVGPVFIVQLLGGLRPSEALALRWSDLKDNVISVTRTLVDQQGLPLQYAPPKSDNSRRAVVVPTIVVDVLQEHRKRQARERLKAGSGWRDEDLIFCDEQGGPLRQDPLRRRLRRLCKAAGVSEKLTPYGLRHSCASLLLEKGIPLKIASERLGHSTIALTADTYSHVTTSMQQQAADALEELVN